MSDEKENEWNNTVTILLGIGCMALISTAAQLAGAWKGWLGEKLKQWTSDKAISAADKATKNVLK